MTGFPGKPIMTSNLTRTGARAAHPIRTEVATLWRLSWPMLVGQLATVGMGVADVAMTGHVSAEELAAVSLGTSVWSIILVTVMGIMMAVNSVVSHEMGAARFDRRVHRQDARLEGDLVEALDDIVDALGALADPTHRLDRFLGHGAASRDCGDGLVGAFDRPVGGLRRRLGPSGGRRRHHLVP